MFQRHSKKETPAFRPEPAEKTPSNRAIVQELSDGFYEVDLKGNYTYVNSVGCVFHGLSAAELPGKNFRQFTTPRCARKVAETFYSVSCTGIAARFRDYEFIHPSGRISYIDLSISLIRDAQSNPIGYRGVARDRSEEKLGALELERYRNFVESIEDGCFEVDLDGTMTFINKAMCKIHGYDSKELLGMNHRGFAAREESKNIYAAFNQVYKTGEPSKIFDYTIIHKDGTPRNLEVSASLIRDEQGKAIGFRGITRNRTEKKAWEVALERYRNFVENVEDACFEVDLHGNITFLNEATTKVFGYPANRLMGMNNREYSSPETAKKIFATFHKVYRTGQSAKITDYEIRHGDGKLRYLDLTAALIKDSSGKTVGFRGICRDVTDIKNTDRENQRLSELLNQIQRLEALGTFSSGMAHNFNNLLMSIQGYITLIKMNIDDGHPQYERLHAVEALIKKGSQLTLQLLGYADSGNRAAKQAHIHKVMAAVALRFKKTTLNVRIVERYAPNTLPVLVDLDQMEHVFMNLFVNAEQSMPKGGALYLDTQNVSLDKNFVTPYGLAPGPYVKITVTDTGQGMDAITRERIFEPFFSTKKNGLGSGLGLASVHGIVKNHGGIITVSSKKDEGAAFSIYLPVAPRQPASQELLPNTTLAPAPPKTILIVDDEKIITEVTAKMVAGMGCKVLTAQGGRQAIEIFRAQAGAIDLVIMDIVMPDLAGDLALAQMGAIDPDVKAILVSGFIDGDQARGCLRRGRQAFLQKPLERDLLCETIKELLVL